MGTIRLRIPQSRAAASTAPATAARDLTSAPVELLAPVATGRPFFLAQLCIHERLEPQGGDLRELSENLVGEMREPSSESVQVGAAERQEAHRPASHRRGPAEDLGSHRRLLREGGGRLERDDENLLAVQSPPRDLDHAAPHDEERGPRPVLFVDDLAVAVMPFVRDPREPRQIRAADSLEERDLLQEADEIAALFSGAGRQRSKRGQRGGARPVQRLRPGQREEELLEAALGRRALLLPGVVGRLAHQNTGFSRSPAFGLGQSLAFRSRQRRYTTSSVQYVKIFCTSPQLLSVDVSTWFPPTRRSAPAASRSSETESRTRYSSETSPAKAGLPVTNVQTVFAYPA